MLSLLVGTVWAFGTFKYFFPLELGKSLFLDVKFFHEKKKKKKEKKPKS